MIDFVGFSDGYRKQQDTGERKRLELAKAFQEFQRQNPTANPMEFQAFIDSMAGGSNYLRGGMPSGDMLKAITDRAGTRRAQEDRDRKFDIFKRTVESRNLLSGAATGIMLNSPGPAGDVYNEEEISKMAAALEEKFGSSLSDIGFDPSTLFSAQARQAAVNSQIGQYLPMVQGLVNSSAGEVNSDTFKGMNIPPALIDPLIDQAKRLETERRETYTINKKQQILAEATRLIGAGSENIYQNLVQTFGANNLPEENSPFVKGLIEEATLAHNKNKLTDERESKKLVDTFVSELISSQGMKSSIVLQDDEKTYEFMISRLNRIPAQDLETIFGAGVTVDKIAKNPSEYLGGYLGEVMQELRLNQRATTASSRQAASQTANDKVDAFVKANIAQATDYFGDVSDSKGGKAQTLTDASVTGAFAAKALASEFEMTPAVLGAIQSVFKNLGEDAAGMNSMELIKLIKQDERFKSVTEGRTLQEAKDRITSRTLNSVGSPEIQTFESWHSNELVEIQGTLEDAQRNLSQAAETFAGDPEGYLEYLRYFNGQVDSAQSQKRDNWKQLGRAQKEANGGLGWLDIEGGVWDQEKIGELDDAMNTQIQGVKELLETQIKNARDAVLSSVRNVETSDGTADNTEVSIKRDINALFDDGSKQQALMNIQTQYGKQGAALSYLLGGLGLNDYTDQDRAIGQTIAMFLQTDRVKFSLKNDQENFEKFIENPVEFMLNSDAEYVVNFFKTKTGKELGEQIGRQ